MVWSSNFEKKVCDWVRILKILTWYWNRWSNVWLAPTKTSINAMMKPKLTYRTDCTAIIWAIRSSGSQVVFRKPVFIFIAFTLCWEQFTNYNAYLVWANEIVFNFNSSNTFSTNDKQNQRYRSVSKMHGRLFNLFHNKLIQFEWYSFAFGFESLCVFFFVPFGLERIDFDRFSNVSNHLK